jgi:cell volume regulation protein A
VADGQLILVAGAMLAAGLLASLVATRVRLPALLLFLGVGMLAGSEGIGGIEFGNYELARSIGIVALALILFEGGLTSGIIEIRPVLRTAISLALVGTLITALVCGLAARWLFGFSMLESLLLGSVVASTDGAATFALLRGSTLKRSLARTLEGEAGFNDPVAILLVLGFIDWIQMPGYGIGDMLVLFVRQMGIGLAAGAGVGWLAVRALRGLRLDSAGLYPVASLAVAALAFGSADVLHGSGFLAVYIAGLWLGSAPIPAKLTINAFHEGLAWVAQMALFLTLGLLVYPSRLGDVALKGLILALVIVLVARPLATFAATAWSGFSAAEKAVLAAAGLRGGVPVVLATFPVIHHVPGSTEFFNIVFFAVLVSTVVQGGGFEPLARWLGATSTEPALPRPLAEAGTIRGLGAEVLEYEIAEGDAIAGAFVRDLALPREAVVNVIVRGDEAIPPRGSTRLRARDRLHVLLRQETADEVRGLLGRWAGGPIGPPPRPRRPIGRAPVFSVRPLPRARIAGDAARPHAVGGELVAERLRIRRDVPGALVVLADGRYAVTGPLVAVGGRDQLRDWAQRRLRHLHADDDERGWLQNVTGALAAES